MIHPRVRAMFAALALLATLFVAGSAPASAVSALSCDGVVAGQYVPGATTTGVRAGSILTTVNPPGGVLTVTTPGTLIEDQDIHGVIKVKAANVTIRNSLERGYPAGITPPGGAGLINASDPAAPNLLVEGVTLLPDVPSPQYTGLIGHDYTARCVDSSGVVDGFGAYNTSNPAGQTNVKITQSWCHGLTLFSPDTQSDNRTHNDCFQGQGAHGVEIAFNNFQSFLSKTSGSQSYAGCPSCSPPKPADPNYTTNHPQGISAIMVNDLTVGGVHYNPSGWNVHDNRIGGGEISVNSGDDGISAGTVLGTFCTNTVDNTAFFAGHHFDFDARITVDTCDSDVYRQNTVVTPATVRHNG